MAEMSPTVSSTSTSSDSPVHPINVLTQSADSILSDPMMKLKWYHPFLTRHSAECMLIDNAPEGSYLLRPSATGGSNEYSLSVKLSHSVQHMKVLRLDDGRYKFGLSHFASINDLKRHFEQEKPVIGGESGINVYLKYPYSREIDEQHLYTDIHHHAVTNMIDISSHRHSDNDSYTSESEDSLDKRISYIHPISSREGYLTKKGKIRKNWKVRWFVLRNTTLSYYKTKQSSKPIRSINLLKATKVDYDYENNTDFGFKIVFPDRTFFIFANNNEDCDQWVELLRATIQRRELLKDSECQL